MFRKQIVVALAFLLLILGTSAWANPLAQAAYDARVKEGGTNATSRANNIQKAVANDKTGNPAQAAYDARIKEGGVDRSARNNPADRIYQAVITEQNNLANQANQLAAKFNTPAASAALDTIEKFLGKIPASQSTKPAKNAEKIVNAYQIAKNYKLLVNKSNQQRSATGAAKDQLNTELANLSLDFIGRVGSLGFGSIRSSLLSSVIDGAKGVIATDKIRVDDMNLVSYDGTLDTYTLYGSDVKYRDLAVVLMKNGVIPDDIHATVAALKLIERMN